MQKLPRSDIKKHIQRLIARWPKDHVRPESVSMQTYLKSRLAPPPPPTPSSPPSAASRISSLFSKPKPQEQQQQQQSEENLQPAKPAEAPLLSTENVNALYLLLENRYQKAYPLPKSLRYPATQPDYYDKLVKEFSEAPYRSLLGRIGVKMRGFLRMK